ncbi:hypothetical protein SDC9_175225 [bioreactor metagenome]|uniref:Uncharacterized protein n=1 Tax=bioreactor metagenome TaxID=1076179 RepID=A0A645GLG4_9ZZZZ
MNLIHLICGQREIEDIQILLNVQRTHRSREDDVPFLNMPAQDDLRIGLTVFCSDFREQRFREQRLIAVTQRIPALDDSAIGRNSRFERFLLVIGMAFHLQHGGFDFGKRKHVFQPIRLEVGQADASDFSCRNGFFHIPPCAAIIAKLLMQQQEVDVAGLQAVKHFVDCNCRNALAVVAGPEFGCDPDVLARDAALFHGLSHAALVLISMRGVDVPVTQLERCETSLFRSFVSENLVNA